MFQATYDFARKITYSMAPFVVSSLHVAPQILLVDFKMQRICFGTMAVLQGSLGLLKSHAADKLVSFFVDRRVEPIQYDLAATSLALIAGGAFLIGDVLIELYVPSNYDDKVNGSQISLNALTQNEEVVAESKQIETNQTSAQPLPSMLSVKEFAEEYGSELEQLCKTRRWNRVETEGLKKIGQGGVKDVFTHPSLNGYVIKVPNGYYWEPLVEHYENAKIGREILKTNRYQNLVIPDVHLISTNCPIVIEEKLEFENVNNTSFPVTNAEIELNDFIKESGFGDIHLRYCNEIENYCGHNARFIVGTENERKIAIFDFA